MNVGLSYILREEMDGICPYLSEFDGKSDIDRLVLAIESSGHRAVPLSFGHDLLSRLASSEVDAVLNYAEGIGGTSREAQVPSVLEMLGIPIIGSSAYCLFLTQNKHLTSAVCREYSIRVPAGRAVSGPEDITDDFLEQSFPCFVKPSREGSSYGIARDAVVRTRAELLQRVQAVVTEFDQPALVEQYIEGQEVCAAIVGNEELEVFPLLEAEISDATGILTYEMKRTGVGIRWREASFSHQSTEHEVRELACRAYRVTGCTDYARVDLRIDGEGRPYIIDMNPTPSLKEHSTFSECAYLAGHTYDDLIGRIIDAASTRHGKKRN